MQWPRQYYRRHDYSTVVPLEARPCNKEWDLKFKELDRDRRFIAELWTISVEVDIVREERKSAR